MAPRARPRAPLRAAAALVGAACLLAPSFVSAPREASPQRALQAAASWAVAVAPALADAAVESTEELSTAAKFARQYLADEEAASQFRPLALVSLLPNLIWIIPIATAVNQAARKRMPFQNDD